MKARTNCSECRKRIYKEAETAYLKTQYQWFGDAAYSMAIFSTVACLAVMKRRSRSKDYIRKFYDEMCFMYDYPEFFGKRVTMTELMKNFEEEYGIDFSRIKLHLETEKEFLRSVKEAKEDDA